MPEPFPNHLVSISNSILSFKHYFLVHDQRFGRTALYLGILALLITALTIGLGLIGYAREAPKIEARQAKELAGKLAGLSFKDGKAASEAQQPEVIYQDYDSPGQERRRAEPAVKPPRRKPRVMVVVLDTTGKVTTPEQAALAAGCPEPKRILLFGRSGVTSLDTTQPPPAPQGGCGGPPPGPKPEAYTKEKLDELRKLIEEKGGKMPELTLDAAGAATFTLEAGKVHLALLTPDLMVLVDTTGKDVPLGQAHQMVVQEKPEIQMPEFLVLVSAAGVMLKAIYDKAPRTLDYGSLGSLNAEAVARWVAVTARQARHDAISGGLAPNSLKMLFYIAFEVLIIALICSIAGVAVNWMMRAGLPYPSILTMAVYAMTPARLLLPVVLALAGLDEAWVAALPFVIGMGYTAMGAYRTARELVGTGLAPAPRL